MLVALLLGCGAEPEPEAPAPIDRTSCVLPCTEMGPEWGGGKTQCNADGTPDTTRCVPAGQILEEVATGVKPAERDAARWANARCNDGTPFSYLLRRTESKTWVVVFEGGFFCDDEKVPCATRKPRLTTTLPVDAGSRSAMQDDGVFSRKPEVNPTFHQANLVGAQYCSSDLWTGEDTERRPTSGSPEGWFFAGRHNARALIEGVVADGLDDADPETRVLVVGHSAGGAGVVANLDTIAELLPQTVKAGRLKMVLDGSWVPPQPTDEKLPNGAKWGALHPACHADAVKAKQAPARCVYGPKWWPYVEKSGIPVLVQIAGLDATQAPIFGVKGPEALEAWKADLRASLEGVPWVFSGGKRYHTLALDPEFVQPSTDGSFREVLTRFWEGKPPERLFPSWETP
ncbi:MAG: hypothetical protein H0V89_14650 [Deltaproteobacteria bacterium]|nr:hypothetical protein [Deltaproteobacteria bacterium]